MTAWGVTCICCIELMGFGRAVDEWKGAFFVDCPVDVTNFNTVRQLWAYKGKGPVCRLCTSAYH